MTKLILSVEQQAIADDVRRLAAAHGIRPHQSTPSEDAPEPVTDEDLMMTELLTFELWEADRKLTVFFNGNHTTDYLRSWKRDDGQALVMADGLVVRAHLPQLFDWLKHGSAFVPHWPTLIEDCIRERGLTPDHHQAADGRATYEFHRGDRRLAIELYPDGSTMTRKVTSAPLNPVAACGELKEEDDVTALFRWFATD